MLKYELSFQDWIGKIQFEETPVVMDSLVSRLQYFVGSRTMDFMHLALCALQRACATGWTLNWAGLKG